MGNRRATDSPFCMTILPRLSWRQGTREREMPCARKRELSRTSESSLSVTSYANEPTAEVLSSPAVRTASCEDRYFERSRRQRIQGFAYDSARSGRRQAEGRHRGGPFVARPAFD